MQRVAKQIAASGKTIGLVPTMGFLHEGHMSLIRKAVRQSDVVVATIFVNPTQFAPNEDLSRYPRNEKRDIKMIRETGGDIVFIPKPEQIYPGGFATFVDVEQLTDTLEGKKRPTHFRGVTTIVAKLFNIIQPDLAVFGMKDYQQAIVLKKMTHDLGYPIKLVIAPTIREKDGLAMSSRNKYFSPDQRIEARCLYYALRTAREMVRSGQVSCPRIEKEMRDVIKSVCRSARIDYIAFTEFSTLKPVRKLARGTICSLAVKLHRVRLIDNMKLM